LKVSNSLTLKTPLFAPFNSLVPLVVLLKLPLLPQNNFVNA
jgi:hypothetical protein